MNALSPTQQNALARIMRESMPQDIGNPDLGKTLDILNRGYVAGTLGGPVDLMNLGLNTVGLGTEKPIMGSEWIGDKLQDWGMVSDKRYPVEELLAGFVNPLKVPLFMAHQVYHGSPHLFDKFDASKIGTGEGAQAYGNGIYFAESPEVADTYKKVLGDEIITSAGHLYTADIPDEWLPRMLDWEKPLSEQGEFVREKLKEIGVDIIPEQYFDKETADFFSDLIIGGIKPGDVAAKEIDPLGKEIYWKYGDKNGLFNLGIPGIRYLDSYSRSNGQGTYNYVIFPGNEDKVKILQRNGQEL